MSVPGQNGQDLQIVGIFPPPQSIAEDNFLQNTLRGYGGEGEEGGDGGWRKGGGGDGTLGRDHCA